MKVLVVDDDPLVGQVHARLVERTVGFDVSGIVATGAATISEVAANPPDLVLLDIHLPDVSGLEVLRKLRTGGSNIGVLMVTAANDTDSIETALNAGAIGYLIKPFEYSELTRRLEEARANLLQLRASHTASQSLVDQLFGRGRGEGAQSRALQRRTSTLPKGLSVETAKIVLDDCRNNSKTSATNCANRLGMSRVSVRKYLEYFTNTGDLKVNLVYGKIGRPERIYSPV